jgi:DNA-binding beta-propeller fold protein YncE
MVAFTTDGKFAYVCSSFTPEVDVVNTATYKIIKKIPVISPFSPNIFYSADGKWMALTHKDVGKVTVINTAAMAIKTVLTTGPITNHVTFTVLNNKSIMLVTVGGENKLRVFDVNNNFKQTDSVALGALPHGIWPSPDGKFAYIGLENDDKVQVVDLGKMELIKTISIGQSPQALVYAANAIQQPEDKINLANLNSENNQVINLTEINMGMGKGVLVVRAIGLTDLVQQSFNHLKPMTTYSLVLTKSVMEPYNPDFIVNIFKTDENGNYIGQTTGIVKTMVDKSVKDFTHIVLFDEAGKVILKTSVSK